MNLHMVWLKAD